MPRKKNNKEDTAPDVEPEEVKIPIKQSWYPKDVEPEASVVCDITTLGTNVVTKMVNTQVKVGELDGGRPLVEWRVISVDEKKVTPDLSYDDVVSLEQAHGKQGWRKWLDTDKFYVCIGGRRLFITKEIHAKLSK